MESREGPEVTEVRVKHVLAGPDMSDFRLLVQFGTFQVQKICIIFAGEAQKSSYFDQKPKYLIKITPKIPKNR